MAVARFRDRPGWSSALAFTAAGDLAALLRPTARLLEWLWLRTGSGFCRESSVRHSNSSAASSNFFTHERSKLASMAGVCICLALLPVRVLTLRNERVFHVFEPLAPRYAPIR